MTITKREYSAIDAQPVVVYGKRDDNSSTSYPVGVTDDGSLRITALELASAVNAIMSIASAKGIASDLRATILSGVITSVGSVTSVTSVTSMGTITSLATLTNITNIGGISAYPVQSAQMNNLAVLSNIQNVVV